MGECNTALRLLRAHLSAAQQIVEALLPEQAPPDEEPETACPFCKEKREDKFEETSYPDERGQLQPRMTCLTCGRSFTPEESNG